MPRAKRNTKRKTILLIPALCLPIPNAKGGAIETLLTEMITENEHMGWANLLVVSLSSDPSVALDYNFTKVVFANRNGLFDLSSLNRLGFKYALLHYFWSAVGHFAKTKIGKLLFPGVVPQIEPFLFRCLRLCKKEKADVVVNEGHSDPSYFWLFRLAVGKKNVYYHLHYSRYDGRKFRSWLKQTISISRFVRRLWDSSEKGRVVHNGIDVRRFTVPDGWNKDLARSALGISPSDVVVLFAGRILPEKGAKELVDAFAALQDKSRYWLIMCGASNFATEESTQYVRNVTASANRLKRCVLTGLIPHEKMPAWYWLADVLVVPSLWEEGAGLVCIEGMAAGLPLIVTDSGGINEYVTDKCALTVNRGPDIVRHLSQAIVFLGENEELRNQMSIASKDRAKFFSANGYYQKFMAAILNER